MLMAFTLSMPSPPTWDGHWSGEGKLHVRVRTLRTPVEPGLYDYNFGDGWRASIRVRPVDAKEARRLRRKSAGFCSYDWMIDEICTHGRILTLEERAATRKEEASARSQEG